MAKKVPQTQALMMDFRGVPQAIQDIAAVAPELPCVTKIQADPEFTKPG